MSEHSEARAKLACVSHQENTLAMSILARNLNPA